MSSFADLTFPTPKSITGGCLCGGIRYQVDFPPDHDFKKSSGSCQCTQCRRQTGALFFSSHKIAPASKCFRYLSPTSSSNPPPPPGFGSPTPPTSNWKENTNTTMPPTWKEYIASPIGARGICTACGSFLYWRPIPSRSTKSTEEGDGQGEGKGEGEGEEDDDYICLAVGTIDPEYLFGEEGSARDQTGKKNKGFGLALVNGGGGHSWCVNEIWGVTDRIEILGGVDGRGDRRDGD
ncbi:hypothetical protein V8F20_011852 [Naviculisporaceae sp. PSN 640]